MKKSKRLKQLEKEHEAYLKKLGVGRTQLPKDGIYEIPSYKTGPRVTSDQIPGNGNRRRVNRYTGDELLGIATMHKSNAIPIRKDSKESAKDVSNMRRN